MLESENVVAAEAEKEDRDVVEKVKQRKMSVGEERAKQKAVHVQRASSSQHPDLALKGENEEAAGEAVIVC